jgi:hypothetical protein
MSPSQRIRRLPGLALNAAWAVAPARRPELSPTWPLDGDAKARIAVRWPAVYEWDRAGLWVDPLRHGIERLVDVEEADVPQPYEGIVVVRLVVDGVEHEVVVDYSDYPVVNDRARAATSLYFKMQWLPSADERVVPGGFPPCYERIYDYVGHLRRRRAQARFEYDVFGRFGAGYAQDVRGRAVAMLSGQTRFHYEGGMKPVGYGEYLREVARSRVCIDLPGNGPFCFRLIDYLAVGACVVAPRPPTELHVPLVDREHIVYASEDLSDLVDLCERYVEDDEERERIARNAGDFFDRNLDRGQIAGYYLRTALDRLGARSVGEGSLPSARGRGL